MAARDSEEPDHLAADGRLGSWKAIAAYLKRDITTVQRWERREGMPVHRHVHDKRGSVYAFRAELDAWQKERRPRPGGEPPVRRRQWIGVATAAIVVVAMAVGWWLTRGELHTDNPLAQARISPLTDFEGLELGAAVSPDGKFAAFLSDRDGTIDAWLTQIGTGEFHNLTKGAAGELLNPEVRSLAFTPDGSLVTMWTRRADTGGVAVWAVPTIGGALREYRDGAVEMDWSSDGRRLVYHTADPGDPTFLVGPDASPARQIYAAPQGTHAHFQTWSPDDRHIYFVRGVPPDEMDLWRMTPDGGSVERVTSHNSRVLYPTFLDERTLWYLATSEDGAGPWLYALDVESRVSRRISFGVEQYSSLATSADRTRLVATVEHSKASLWRVSIAASVAADAEAARVAIPTVGAFAPRLGPDKLYYVSAKNDGHAICVLADGTATELWSAPQTRVIGGPAIGPGGRSIAFTAERAGGTKLYVLDVASRNTRVLGDALEIRGAAAWTPNGDSITVGVNVNGTPLIYKVPLDGQPPSPMVQSYSINPLWSPDGAFLVYADADAGPDFVLKAVNADGTPRALPDIKLPRGARRVSFVPGSNALIVLQGAMRHSNFWHIDLGSGERRQLTNFGREFTVRDFDVTADGTAIVFDRRQENSDLALIELRPAR